MQNIRGHQNEYNLPTPNKQYVNQQYQLGQPAYQQSYHYQQSYPLERNVRSPNVKYMLIDRPMQQAVTINPIAGFTNNYKELETRNEYRNVPIEENNREKINKLELLVEEQSKEISQLKIMINDIIEDIRQKETINIEIKEPEEKLVTKKNDGRVGGIRYMSGTLSDEVIQGLSDEEIQGSINRIAVAASTNKQNTKGVHAKINLEKLRKEKKRRKEL